MIGPLQLNAELQSELIEQIVEEVVRRVLAAQRPASRWLSGAQAAAEYLDWPVARVYKSLRRLPHSRDGRRLMFQTTQLDRFIADGYDGPERFAQHLEVPPCTPTRGDPNR